MSTARRASRTEPAVRHRAGPTSPADLPPHSTERPATRLRPRQSRPTATRDVELNLAHTFGLVCGMDEVGRGALAGPVCVGAAVVDSGSGAPPEGLTDSKLLTARRRVAMGPAVREWVIDAALGWASPGEIDAVGIVGALRLAGLRALAELGGRSIIPGVVLLDGSHDWLSSPSPDLFAFDVIDEGGAGSRATVDQGGAVDCCMVPEFLGPVVTRVKADVTCAVVSAASVLAKVERDEYMSRLADPGYGWAANKGYASAGHVEGLRTLGASDDHRRTWRLPGVSAD